METKVKKKQIDPLGELLMIMWIIFEIYFHWNDINS